MNILLWVIQVLLALYSVMGALWKFANPSSAVPTLSAIPHSAWIAISVIEILCAVGLVLPAIKKSLAKAAPIAATVLIMEMLIYCAVHFSAGGTMGVNVAFWLVEAVIAGFIVYGRRGSLR